MPAAIVGWPMNRAAKGIINVRPSRRRMEPRTLLQQFHGLRGSAPFAREAARPLRAGRLGLRDLGGQAARRVSLDAVDGAGLTSDRPSCKSRDVRLGRCWSRRAVVAQAPLPCAGMSAGFHDAPAGTPPAANLQTRTDGRKAASSKNPMSDASDKNDWTKPAAMAIPKEGYFTLEQGRYGPTYPRTPACHGFTIIAKIKPGTEADIRAYGKRIEDTIAASPHALAPLQLHYLRWVLFDIGPDKYFMYQGIFDTDFDKYTEDAVQLFKATGVDTIFEKLEGFPDGLEDERAGVHQVRPRPSVSELPRIRRISLRVGRRNQEGPRAEAGVLVHARPDAVNGPHARSGCDARTGRHSTLSPDAAPSAGGAIRISAAFDSRITDGPGCPASSIVSVAAARSSPAARSIRAGSPWRSPGTACGHWVSTTHPWRRFPTSFVKGWRLGPRSLAIPERTIPITGWAVSRARTFTRS